jgi:tetratricopeptide (TPR) repeat protein
LLQKYIQENPKASNIDDAYGRLLGVLYKIDPVKTIQVADEILARPRDPESKLWKNAYGYKFQALHKQIQDLGRKVLDTESDPAVLQTAANYDRENSPQLYEKAIGEREKDAKPELYPSLRDLHSAYARRLNELGRKQDALKQVLQAIDLTKARITELEALPKEDPKRRDLEWIPSSLASRYQEAASRLYDTGETGKGLEFLSRAEKVLGNPSREQRSWIEEIRGKIYTAMGRTTEALECYTRSFAFQMNIDTLDRIRSLAERSGKKPEDFIASARQIRLEGAEPFKPFELKTIEGSAKTLDALKGKVTLVNFFFPT